MLYGITALNLGYYENEGNPGSEEHVHLKATDGGDGISLEYDYYVKFHDPQEDIVTVHNTSSPEFPAEGASSAPAGWIPFATSQDGQTIARTDTVSIEVGGEVSVEGSSGGDAFAKMFGLKVGIKVEAKHTESHQVTVTYAVPEHTIRTVYYANRKITKDGTCSIWNYNGYDHDGTWSGNALTEELMYCCTDIPLED